MSAIRQRVLKRRAEPGKRVLIVDDDDEIVEAVQYALQSKGFTILVARDGNQGLAMAEREDPDLVILDLELEKGFIASDAVTQIHELAPKARIVIYSAHSSFQIVTHMKFGIMKPYRAVHYLSL